LGLQNADNNYIIRLHKQQHKQGKMMTVEQANTEAKKLYRQLWIMKGTTGRKAVEKRLSELQKFIANSER
jgi:hypothetical protein